MKKIQIYEQALKEVFTYEETRDYSLDRIVEAMKLLGNPLKDIKVIHIAGTNGKGSTSRMIFSVLRQAGKKVGTYNQPHLKDIRERFLTDTGMISKQQFVDILNKLLELPLTFSYFEQTTLISFLFFQLKSVEYAIIEVGFGGLLDSTNVVNPEITCITSIGFDHTKILGDTLEEISFQKAGIIKSGIPIVYNHENTVIKNIAEERNAPIIFTDRKVQTNLLGEYQQRNAGLAWEICKYFCISEEDIKRGLQTVEHRGRLQYLENNLLIDGAHNRDGLQELKKYIDSIEQNFTDIYYCFSLKHDKSSKLITDTFGKDKKYILIEGHHELLEKTDTLKKEMYENKISDIEILTPEQIKKRQCREKNSLYIVFGSLYMIGDFYE